MWIRSQDKRSLIQCKWFNIGFAHKKEVIWGDIGIPNEGNPGMLLGEYESEERTMTVLNTIEQVILRGGSYFQMPEA
jgi:hypothetical protein